MSGLQTTRGTRRGPPAAVPEARPVSSLCCHGAPRPRPGGLGGAEARRPPRDFGEGHRPRRGWRPPSVHAHGLSRKLDELTHGLRPHTHVHTHTRRAHTHVHTNKHTHARMCTLMYTHTCAHAHTHEHTNARVRAHVRTHIRTHRAKRLPCGTSRSCPHASRVGTTGAARPVLPTPPLRGGPARRSRDGGHAQAAEPLSGDQRRTARWPRLQRPAGRPPFHVPRHSSQSRNVATSTGAQRWRRPRPTTAPGASGTRTERGVVTCLSPPGPAQ